jgi:curved DNA-binding protein CbpA
MANYSYCKKDFKDEMNNKYENYLNDREVNKIVPPPNENISNENISNENKHTKKKHQPAPTEYNKEEFLDEIMRIHNDVYFNPYKILEIDREYTPETLKEKYKEMALKYHPDKGGDVEVFQDITKSYIYLLKKYKENMPDKQIFELKDEFNNFSKEMKNNKNTLLGDRNFNLDNFNNAFDQHFTKTTKGYGDFLKNGDTNIEKEQSNSYIFSDNFNLSIFNKIFNTTSKKIKKESVIIYKEPETIFQSSAGYSEIGEDDELADYTSGFTFDKKINYTDCKRAYTAPEDLNSIEMDSYNNIDELEKHRKNISYNMSDEDKHKYNNFIELNRIKELQRQNKIEKTDLNILKKYKKFNNIMLENN